MGQSVAIVPAVVVVVGALIAAFTDIWKYKVHNVLTLPFLASGLAYHGLTHGWPGLAASLAGALFGFGVLFVFYLMGGMGAGDVKPVLARPSMAAPKSERKGIMVQGKTPEEMADELAKALAKEGVI